MESESSAQIWLRSVEGALLPVTALRFVERCAPAPVGLLLGDAAPAAAGRGAARREDSGSSAAPSREVGGADMGSDTTGMLSGGTNDGLDDAPPGRRSRALWIWLGTPLSRASSIALDDSLA